MAVDYEWCCEVVDEHEDIVDSYHSDTLEDAIKWQQLATESDDPYTYQICLVRTEETFNGSRAWAYLTSGQLPEYFADACGHDTTKVPQRFHREVAKTPV